MTAGRPSPYRVGLLGPSRLSPNTEALLGNLGAMLRGHFDLHLALGSHCESTRLRSYYRIHPYDLLAMDRGEIRTALSACRRLVNEARPHLLVSLVNPASTGLAVATVGRRSAIANIVRMSGHSFEEAAAHRRPWKRLKAWLLHDRMAGTAYRRAGHIIALGRRLKEALVIRGIDPARITVLPQPVDRERFRPLPEEAKAALKTALGLAPERKTILYAGRLSWLKGADRLQDIITAVGSRSQRFQFCLAGQGEYQSRLAGFPETLVHMAGPVPHARVADFFQAADLLVLPSRTEGLPNTILEALACRVPVMAAPVGDIPDWVTRTGTEPADYADYILSENWAVDSLPETMDPGRLDEAYVKLFRDVIEGRV